MGRAECGSGAIDRVREDLDRRSDLPTGEKCSPEGGAVAEQLRVVLIQVQRVDGDDVLQELRLGVRSADHQARSGDGLGRCPGQVVVRPEHIHQLRCHELEPRDRPSVVPGRQQALRHSQPDP